MRGFSIPEGSRQPPDVGQHVLLWHDDVVHEDHSRGGGAQRELALDLGRRQSLHLLLQDETLDALVLRLGPHLGMKGKSESVDFKS